MCNDSFRTNFDVSVDYFGYGDVTKSTKPSQITGGSPFSISYWSQGDKSPFGIATCDVDSSYLKIILPAGLATSGPTGGATRNCVVLTSNDAYTISGGAGLDTFVVRYKGVNNYCIEINYVYTCGLSGNIEIPFYKEYVGSRSCSSAIIRTAPSATQCYFVDTVEAICPSPCPAGVSNGKPEAYRATLGCTDGNMTTRVDSTALIIYSRKHVMNYDSFSVYLIAKQYGNYNNLYLDLNLGSANASTNMQQFVSGTFYRSRSANVSSCALPTPTISGPINEQSLTFNLTNCIPAGGVNPADSYWVEIKMAINGNNTVRSPYQKLIVSQANFYN